MSKQLDKPKQHFHAPTVLAFAATVFIIVLAVSVGFAWGVHTATQPTQGKEIGQTFDRASFKMQQPVFERDLL